MRTVDSLKGSGKRNIPELTISYEGFFAASVIYLTLPVIIFFIGYLKPVWAVLFGALTLAAAVCSVHACGKKSRGIPEKDNRITLNISFIAFLIPLILIVMFLGGVSEFGWSTIDHRVRYAVLNDLVEYKWPVIYDFSTQQDPIVSASLGSGSAAFSYYFVFWMIPALTGKMFGLMAARVALFLWASAGMFLVCTGACLLYKKASKMLIIALILFAGFDVIPYAINLITDTTTTWEGWNLHLYIHGNFYQIMNVFNQSIPGWIITLMLLLSPDDYSVGLMGGLMFCYSPWATIGILPMCVCKLVLSVREYAAREGKSNGRSVLHTLLTPGNLPVPIVALVCFGMLYTANSDATGSSGFIWEFYSSPLTLIKEYIWLVIFDFGIWFLLIIRDHKRDGMLWTALGTLLVLPVYKITIANDFLMRGSMAPMFMISLYSVMYVTDRFGECREKQASVKDAVRSRIAVVMLAVAAFTACNFMFYSSLVSYQIIALDESEEDVSHDIGSFGNIRHADQLPMVQTQFYVFDYEDAPFFKYLAK